MNFNFSPESEDAVSFITNYSDKVRKSYIRAAEKEYGFTIVITKTYSTYGDDLNLEAMNLAQAFMDWIFSQNRKRIYPEFPDNCQIKKDGVPAEHAESGRYLCREGACTVYDPVQADLF